MGRVVCRTLVSTTMNFDKQHSLGDLVKIENAEIYWGSNGTIAVVASKEWCEYLSGETNTIPEPQGDDIPFEFDEEEFMRFIGQEVR